METRALLGRNGEDAQIGVIEIDPAHDPRMDYLRLWPPRPKIHIQDDTTPSIKKPYTAKTPDDDVSVIPTDEWASHTFRDSFLRLSKTGQTKGDKLSLVLLAVCSGSHPIPGRAGRPSFDVELGPVTQCADYASRPLPIGHLH